MIVTMIAAAALAPAPAVDVDRFLTCIVQIEGHAWTDPGGAYAIQRDTWRDYTRLPYAAASIKGHADVVAARHLAWLARSLADEGWPVNAYTLAGCWRWGFTGFKQRANAGRVDYAARFWQLYHSTHKF